MLAATPPPTPSRFKSSLLQDLPGLGDQHIHDRFLETRREICHQFGRRLYHSPLLVRPAQGVEYGGLQTREAEHRAIVMQEGSRKGEGSRISVACRPLDLGSSRVAQVEQARDLVESLTGRVIGRSA